MPIIFPAEGGATLVFNGSCAPEEADPLLEWLRHTDDPGADLSACTDLHTALAQLMMAARVRLVARPADPCLAACLAPCLVMLDRSAGAPS